VASLGTFGNQSSGGTTAKKQFRLSAGMVRDSCHPLRLGSERWRYIRREYAVQHSERCATAGGTRATSDELLMIYQKDGKQRYGKMASAGPPDEKGGARIRESPRTMHRRRSLRHEFAQKTQQPNHRLSPW
jgi:hypothetical protein